MQALQASFVVGRFGASSVPLKLQHLCHWCCGPKNEANQIATGAPDRQQISGGSCTNNLHGGTDTPKEIPLFYSWRLLWLDINIKRLGQRMTNVCKCSATSVWGKCGSSPPAIVHPHAEARHGVELVQGRRIPPRTPSRVNDCVVEMRWLMRDGVRGNAAVLGQLNAMSVFRVRMYIAEGRRSAPPTHQRGRGFGNVSVVAVGGGGYESQKCFVLKTCLWPTCAA